MRTRQGLYDCHPSARIKARSKFANLLCAARDLLFTRSGTADPIEHNNCFMD